MLPGQIRNNGVMYVYGIYMIHHLYLYLLYLHRYTCLKVCYFKSEIKNKSWNES
jgi:hypothetical protein